MHTHVDAVPVQVRDRARLVVTEVVGGATAAPQRCLLAAPARHTPGRVGPQSSETAAAQQCAEARTRSRGWPVEASATLWPLPPASSRHVIRSTTARHDRAPRTRRPIIATIACAAIGTRTPIGKAQSWRAGLGLGVRPARPPTGASHPAYQPCTTRGCPCWQGRCDSGGGGGAGFFLLRAPPGRGAVGHLPAGSQVLVMDYRAGVSGPPRHAGRWVGVPP